MSRHVSVRLSLGDANVLRFLVRRELERSAALVALSKSEWPHDVAMHERHHEQNERLYAKLDDALADTVIGRAQR